MAEERMLEIGGVREPRSSEILAMLGITLGLVGLTRFPFARSGPIESDEFGFVAQMNSCWLPMNHTLFKALGRAIGMVVGGHYQGLIVLDILVSGLALVSLWWWLRALVKPSTAAATTVLVGVSPLFWSLGEMAANYTMIPLVGSFLLGIAYRGWSDPRPWHPFAAAVVLAAGTGYREDIGTFFLPIFFLIVWCHRWRPAVVALALFTVLNLAWLVPMIDQAGGWDEYRRKSAEYAEAAGYKNSVFYLGFVDAPLRYAVKICLALLATFGPGLVFLPRGVVRLGRSDGDRRFLGLLSLSIAPALATHLLIQFGMAGYSFFYLPALTALLAVGVGRTFDARISSVGDQATGRLLGLACLLAAVFLFYPADIHRPGWRGDFDLSVGRYSRVGLRENLAERSNSIWRTRNSVSIGARSSGEDGDRSTISGNE